MLQHPHCSQISMDAAALGPTVLFRIAFTVRMGSSLEGQEARQSPQWAQSLTEKEGHESRSITWSERV